MPDYRKLALTALSLLWAPLIISLAACQSMGSPSEQRAFVAAHVIRTPQPADAEAAPIYLARDAAFAHSDNEGRTVLARGYAHP